MPQGLERRRPVWGAMSDVCLARTSSTSEGVWLEKVMFLETSVKSLKETAAGRTALLAAFEAVRPTFRSLLIGDEREGEDRRVRNVHEVVARATEPPAETR